MKGVIIMKKKFIKKVKGMTLIEILVAMAVFTVAGLMMVKVGAASKTQLMNSNHMNNKIQAEVAVGTSEDSANKLRDEYGGNGETSVHFDTPFGRVEARRYDTGNADAYSGKNCGTNLEDGECLQFYDVVTSTGT